jgi:hypothetical protein
VSTNEVLHLLGRPVCHGGAECGLGSSDTVARGKQGVSAGDHRLRLEVELAQELALPAVPGAGPHGADVGHGQHQQELQPLGALHGPGEGADRARVGDIAAEGDVAHEQMVLDEPGDGFRLGRAHAKAR